MQHTLSRSKIHHSVYLFIPLGLFNMPNRKLWDFSVEKQLAKTMAYGT